MERKGSLPHSRVPATCPFSEPDESSPCHPYPLPEVHLDIILPSTSGFSKWRVSLRFPHQNPVYTSALTHAAAYSAHPILLDLITRIIFGEEYRSRSSSLCSILHSLLTSFLLGQNIILSTLFSNTLSLRSSLKVRDQVSHPYKTTGKIKALKLFLYVNIVL